MNEKLLTIFLAALKTKFIGVPDAILERVAKKKSETLTDEGQINSIVEGITLQNIFDSYGDFRATEATQSAVSNYEKKYGIKDGKLADLAKTEDEEKQKEIEGLPEPVRKMFEAQSRQIAELTKTVQGAVSTVSTSKKQADAKVLFGNAKLPEKWLSRINVDSEISIENQIKELQGEYAEIKQGIVNSTVEAGDYVPDTKGKEMTEKDWVTFMDGDGDASEAPGVTSLGMDGE